MKRRSSGPAEDESLLDRLRSNEQAAQAEFVRRWAPRFKGILRAHGFSPADAYDLGFSCTTHVLIKVGCYRGDTTGFNAWILAVGRNFAEDWRRKNGRVKFAALSDSLPSPDLWSSDEPRVASSRTAKLLEVVASLPLIDRKIIDLRYLHGSATFEEIAEVLKITANSARQRHHRILKRIKGLLE